MYTPHKQCQDFIKCQEPVTPPTSLEATDDGPFEVEVGVSFDTDVCANDVNPEGTPVGPVTSICGQAVTPGGSVMTTDGMYDLGADGCTITFTALPAANGTTVVCPYEVTDGEGDTASADLTYTVADTSLEAEDDGPVDATVGDPVDVDLCANDVNPEGTAVGPVTKICGQAVVAGGTVTTANGTYVLGADGCTITYTPSAAAVAASPVVCEYEITDAEGDTDTADVTFNVTSTSLEATDDGPVDAPIGTAVSVDLCANDTNPEGTAIGPVTSICGQAITPGGSVTTADGTYDLGADGCTLTFTALAAAAGTDVVCEYEITDAEGDTAAADVTFAVPSSLERQTSIDDTDPTNFTMTQSGTCVGAAMPDTSKFVTKFGKQLACREYPLPDPTVRTDLLANDYVRTAMGPVIPVFELCTENGVMTFTWDGGIPFSATLKADIEAEFSLSGGTVSWNNYSVDELITGLNGLRALKGDSIDYHDTLWGAERTGVTDPDEPCIGEFMDAPEWVIEHGTVEANDGGACDGDVSDADTTEYYYRKFYREFWEVRIGIDTPTNHADGTGGFPRTGSYKVINYIRNTVGAGAFPLPSVANTCVAPVPTLTATIESDDGAPTSTVLSNSGVAVDTVTTLGNPDGHYKDHWAVNNTQGWDVEANYVARLPNPSDFPPPGEWRVIFNKYEMQSLVLSPERIGIGMRIEPASASATGQFFDANVAAGSENGTVQHVEAGVTRAQIINGQENGYSFCGQTTCGPQTFVMDSVVDMEVLDAATAPTLAPANDGAASPIIPGLRFKMWVLMTRFF